MTKSKTKLNVPQRYRPKTLSKADYRKQTRNLKKSRRLYKKGKYFQRPKVKSFKSKPSGHVENAKRMYNIDSISASAELAKATKCKRIALEKIVKKGQGAYYSSGSRPNQSAHSWGRARLASAITGGNASVIDYNTLNEYCSPSSKALRLATRRRREKGMGTSKKSKKKSKKK